MRDALDSATPLVFALANHADVAQVVALVQSAYRGEASRQGWTTEADLIDGQRIDAEMVADLLDRPATEILLARAGGELVACCELQHRPEQQQAYLGMFAVQPTLQAHGLGRRVLAEAERVARDRWGARQMVLQVIDARDQLIAWYARRGYAPTGETAPFPYGDERFGRPTRSDLRFAELAKPL